MCWSPIRTTPMRHIVNFTFSKVFINLVLDGMKFNEQQTQVVTQGVKLGTVKRVIEKGQRLTMANIVHKTNMKMGGLNYWVPPNHE